MYKFSRRFNLCSNFSLAGWFTKMITYPNKAWRCQAWSRDFVKLEGKCKYKDNSNNNINLNNFVVAMI